MTDITKTIAPKTDQLNADDFFIEKEKTIRITGVRSMDSKEQPIAISYEGDKGKPWKPSLGMRRVLVELWGQDAAKEADKFYTGRMVKLFRDPEVKFGSEKVGGIRISHASNITHDTKILLTVSKARRVEFVVHPLKDEPAKKSVDAPPTKELTQNQKNFQRIRTAIEASANEIDLFDLWNTGEPSGYSVEIAAIKEASQEKYDQLLKMYDDKKATFPPDYSNA